MDSFGTFFPYVSYLLDTPVNSHHSPTNYLVCGLSFNVLVQPSTWDLSLPQALNELYCEYEIVRERGECLT